MAGKEQHHVWRMLQRGFSFTDRGPDQIFVYSRIGQPQQTVTRYVGVEKFFYGDPDSPADKNITDYENSVQSFIQDVRQLPNGSKLASHICGGLVAHLEMRSSFLRTQLNEVASEALTLLKDAFSSPDSFQKMMTQYFSSNTTEIEQKLTKMGLSDADKEFFRSIAPLVLPTVITDGHATVSSPIVGALDEFIQMIPDLTKNAHIQSLVSPFSEVDRAKIHQKLQFIVRKFDSDCLILPDTCLGFLMTGKCAPVSQKGDKIESVIVPVSSTTAIFGSSGLTTELSIETINRVLASCATEFFLANQESATLQRLAARIGRNAVMMPKAEIKKILSLRSILESI